MGSKRFQVETDITSRMHETDNLFDQVSDELRPYLEFMDTAGDGYEFQRAVILDHDPEQDLDKQSMVLASTEEGALKVARALAGMNADFDVAYVAIDDYNGQPIAGVDVTELDALEKLLKKIKQLRQQDAGEQTDA